MNFSFNSNTFQQFNPTASRQKFGLLALSILMVVGVAFTVVGVVMIQASQIDPSWTKVVGTVVSSTPNQSANSNGSGTTTSYKPRITYQAAGQTYSVDSSVGTSSKPATDSAATVAYDPAHPDTAKAVQSTSTSALQYLFPAIGILCLIIGPIAFIRARRRTSDINQLTKSGQKLAGVLVDIQTVNSSGYNPTGNNAVNNNYNSPPTYKIVVSATNLSGAVQNYVSDTLVGIGGLAMVNFRQTPIPIDVYVNPSKPSDYYVDVADIPNLTPQRIVELLQAVVQPQAQTQPQSLAPANAAPFPIPPAQNQPQPMVPMATGPAPIPQSQPTLSADHPNPDNWPVGR